MRAGANMKYRPKPALVALALGLVITDATAQLSLPPETRNAALRYWMSFALMQDPPADKSTADLLERAASGKAPWDESRLGPILDANREALATMQRATTLPACDWALEYRLGPTAPIAHLAKARVLARLNTLAGMRLTARGDRSQAIETWLGGVRFSQHVAQGGTLISLLTARAALSANLRALNEAATSVSDEGQRKRISALLQALPDTAFDWGEAMRLEGALVEVTVQQLSNAADPRAWYRDVLGAPAPENFTVPKPPEVAAFRRLMARVAEALRLPPDVARQRLNDLENTQKTLHPYLRDLIPSLSRINDVRAELQAERQKLLAVIAVPR